MSAKKLASVDAQNYIGLLRNAKNWCCIDDLTRLSGTRVYRRGTGSGWPPLGAATGANEPHTHLGLVIYV